ncbi:uncharacterized protein FIESC28_06780 [Fusarium coffeatum]|uniref:Uncharacterized protein n=1 Tax=Fusarium coffeatum TaxID=231269 RepID=A0A366RKP9_9HYPO|nr:uncharacterized protein FIESC28_06780 [Fusarium coffeatum]RBR16865.1 hypothetical protein FIESC28_06780 [Fusarium coffeatum]
MQASSSPSLKRPPWRVRRTTHPNLPPSSPSPIFDSAPNPSSTSSMVDFGINDTPDPPVNSETDLISFDTDGFGDDTPKPPKSPESDLISFSPERGDKSTRNPLENPQTNPIIFGPDDFGDNDTSNYPANHGLDLIFFGPVEDGISNLTINPAPSPEPREGSFIKFTQKGISDLASAAGLTNEERLSLVHAVSVFMEGWGHEEIPETPKWNSQLGRNFSPFEYSVDFNLKTGKKKVGFRFELPHGNTIQAMQESADKLTDNLSSTYFEVVLHGFYLVRYIFFVPYHLGPFVAWFGYDDLAWKIYFDIRAQGQDNAGRLIYQALHHLDMTKAWHVIDDVIDWGFGLPIRLGVDLVNEDYARVEVVVDFWGQTFKNFAHSATERYYPRNDEVATEDEVLRLCRILLGVEDDDTSCIGEAPLISYSFTHAKDRDVNLEMTVHIPVGSYMHDDAQFQKRVEDWVRGLSHVLSEQQIDNFVESYQECLKAIARRPLEEGSGLQSWFSLKESIKDGTVVTVHFSTEMYGALPVMETVAGLSVP